MAIKVFYSFDKNLHGENTALLTRVYLELRHQNQRGHLNRGVYFLNPGNLIKRTRTQAK